MRSPLDVAFFTDPGLREDRLFEEQSRDGVREPFRALQRRIREAGGDMHTADLYESDGRVPDLILFLDVPPEPIAAELPAAWAAVRRWVILGETEVVRPQNWDPAAHAQFSRLFTWSDSLVDAVRFFRLYYPNPIDVVLDEPAARDGFCTLIAANKRASHPLELYSERRNAIRWFERNRPGELDLYGPGWDLPVLTGLPKLLRAPNRLPVGVRRRLAPRRPSWRGPVDDKRSVLRRYRFAICFENTRDVEGYITEKLFDCLIAGTIPVYLGAPDVADRVPADCFVDFRRFGSYPVLHEHLSSLSDEDCESTRTAGREFLRSDRARPFAVETWVETLLEHIASAADDSER